MDRLVDLIKVYDNDLEDDVCDYLVYHFEKSFNRHKKTLRNRTPNFTEYNLSRNASVSYTHLTLPTTPYV